MTPKKAWSLKKPWANHLKVFSSIAYAKALEERRTKLEDKSQKCIFLGYGDNASGYKLYNPITERNVWSWDVDSDKQQIWDLKDDKKKQVTMEEQEEKEPPTQIHMEAGESSSPARWSGSTTHKTSCLQDIYTTTHRIKIDEDFGMFCLFAGCDPLTFEKAYQEEKWRKVMEEEI